MELRQFQQYLPERSYKTLDRANQFSTQKIEIVKDVVEKYLVDNNLDASSICFIVVGSIGRKEALDASDIDLIPIIQDGYSKAFVSHDHEIREKLRTVTGIKVSAGEDLTQFTELKDLIDTESIGGGKDGSPQLTKRILILTEGVQVGGRFPLNKIKEAIIDAYSRYDSTRGKHILTLCNDLARYYRTLCIEYKAKVDVNGKDWATRNAKLRHSRKVWYFASLLAIASKSLSSLHDTEAFKKDLLLLFDYTPICRIFASVGENEYPSVGRLLEYYAWFLEFMAVDTNRKKLAKINYESRYKDVSNIYYPVKLNSDMIHKHILIILEDLPVNVRKKIIDWFLF